MSSKTSLPHNPMNSMGHQAVSYKQTNFIVVWFDDPALSITNNAQRTIADLEHIVGTLTIFNDADKCVEYVNNVKDHQVLLIVGEAIGAQVVRRVLQASKLKSVYIRCSNQSIHPPWAAGCKSVNCIFVDGRSICERIEIDTEGNSIDFDVTDGPSILFATSENHNKQDVKFMYSQLLIYTLTRMTYSSDDIDNLIKFLEDKCKNQTKDIEKIKEFKDNYGNESPVWCYTNYAFLYKTLNSALRTCDVDALCRMGVFIKSLHQQIVELHTSMPRPEILKLYRGLVISTSAFEEIKKKKGGLLSFNSFLSTSLNKGPADMFADQPSSDQTGVLFEITVTRSISASVVYANIQGMSQFADEQEFLFTIGSVFRIESVEQLDGDRKWCFHLTLTTDHDPELAQLTNYIRSQLPQEDLLSLCLVLWGMGEFTKVKDLSEAAIKTCKDAWMLPIWYLALGFAYMSMQDKQSALTNLELLLEYSSPLSTDKETSDTTHMTKGLIFLIQGELDLALVNFQAAKQNIRECVSDKKQQIIPSFCDQLISIILQEQGHFSDAFEHQTRVYDMAKKCLPPTHPIIGECLTHFGITYLNEGQLDEALLCMEQSVRIQQNSLLPEHIHTVHSQGIYETLRCIKNDRSISEYPTPSLSTDLPKWQSDLQKCPQDLLYFARLYLKHNKIDESLSILDQYLNIQKENPLLGHSDLAKAYFYRGLCYKEKANFSEALENLGKGRKIATQHFEETHPARIDFTLLIAQIHAEQGNNDEALIVVDKCKGLILKVPEVMAKSSDPSRLKRIALIFKIQGLEHLEKEDYKKALSGFQSCLTIHMNFLSPEHPDVGEIYKYIAQAYASMGNYSDALANYKKAQYIFEKCLSPDDSEVAEIWESLGGVYSHLKQYDNALFAYDKHLQIQKNTLPQDHLDFADTYASIGYILDVQQKYSDAIIIHHKALAIQLTHLPEGDPKFIKTYNMLGLLYDVTRQYPDALSAFEKVLEIQSVTLPSGSIEIAETHKGIAHIYYSTKQYEKALRHFQKSLDIQMSSPSPNNLDLVDTLSTVGGIYREQNNPSDALAQDRLALNILLPCVSSKDVILAKKWAALGTDYRMLHDYQQALTAFNQSIEILSNGLPSEHSVAASIHIVMGSICYDTGEYERALSCFQKCLSVQKSLLPPEHLDVAEIQSLIGDAAKKLNNLSDALMNYQFALDIQLKHLPETCFKTIKTWDNLGWVYYGLRQYEDSLSAFNECLEYQLNVLPSDHIDISVTHKQIALVYYKAGKYEDAFLSFQACLDVEMRSLPSDHLGIAETQSLMGDVCCKLNHSSDALNYYQYTLDIQLKHLSTANLKIIITWRNLGKVYFTLEQYDNSLSAFNKCLEYQLNALPSDHIDVSVTHKQIACVYDIVEKYEEALTSFRECLVIQKSSLPPKHPYIADTESWIFRVSSKLSNVLDTSSTQRQAL